MIAVRKGSKVSYCSQVSFEGKCQIVYRPENHNLNGGAKVWIEVDATTEISMESQTIIVKQPHNQGSFQLTLSPLRLRL